VNSFKQRTSKVPPKSRYFWLEMVLMGEVYTARVQCRVCTRQAPSGMTNVARPGRPGLICTCQKQCVIQPFMQQVETARALQARAWKIGWEWLSPLAQRHILRPLSCPRTCVLPQTQTPPAGAHQAVSIHVGVGLDRKRHCAKRHGSNSDAPAASPLYGCSCQACN